MAAVEAIPPPFFSPYLDDQLSKLAARQIPWEVRWLPNHD
jgi:V-type H+-transporting ATPase subunit H